ncbi:MAG: M20/M25/M40 family metallo-hydrolase [Deltaproteobacteria bacterium]|nr:M20/M25/M40 family metallo-hydrolase [Deltaproteobacteria bacterium]
MEQELIETFFRMVRISSESGNEKDFIGYLNGLFSKELGAECFIDDYGNLIAKVPARNSSSDRSVLFGVHADTVKPGIGIEPVLEDQIIRSRGNTILGADDKAGIAELVEAIKTVDRHPPIEIAVSREEEVGFKGAKNIDTSLLKSDFGFVMDSDSLEDIIIGGPSYMSIKVDITGRSAHAGMEPEKGISSIKAASYAISMIKEGWVDDETTVNVGVIRGGEVLNAVPEKTEVKVECRSQTHEKCLGRSELIGRIFQNAAESIGAKAEITMELLVKCYQVPEDAESVAIAKRAIVSAGLAPNTKVICAGTDAAIYNEKGIETVVMGIGVRSEHTKEEHITVGDMMKGVEIIRNILKETC